MSLITRCSACGTMFKVVADQLKISQGWVRCGHCSEIFDAAAHLQPYESQAVIDPPSTKGPLLSADVQVAPEVTEPPASVGAGQAPSSSIVSSLSGEVPAPRPSMSEIQVSLPPDLAADIFASSVNPESSDLPDSGPLVKTTAQVHRNVFADSEEPGQSTQDVSFVRDARRNAFWRGAGVRSALVLSALVLLSVLFVQVARFQTNALLAWLPSFGPGLQALCVPLNCEVGPTKQIESVLIDSSSFSKIAADAYRLKVVIKNAGTIALAMPSLELTLTDTQDQALLRRILAPGELGVTDGSLAAGAEFSGVVAIKISESATGAGAAPSPLRIAGYRVLAFYP